MGLAPVQPARKRITTAVRMALEGRSAPQRPSRMLPKHLLRGVGSWYQRPPRAFQSSAAWLLPILMFLMGGSVINLGEVLLVKSKSDKTHVAPQ